MPDIISEGPYMIAGVGLLALTFQILSYSRRETSEGILRVDEIIRSEIMKLIDPPNTPDLSIEYICKQRRRKAHLQKDNQNFFGLFVASSISLVSIGALPFLGFNQNYFITFKMVFGWLFILSLIIGIYYIGRLFFELHAISNEPRQPRQ